MMVSSLRQIRARPRFPLRIAELNSSAIGQHFSRALGKFGRIISDPNHSVRTQLTGMHDHPIKGFLACLLTNGGVGFNVAAHELLKPAHDALSDARGSNYYAPYDTKISLDGTPSDVIPGCYYHWNLLRSNDLAINCGGTPRSACTRRLHCLVGRHRGSRAHSWFSS